MNTTVTQLGQIRVAIVDDHPMVRMGIRTMLSTWGRCAGIVEAKDGLDYEQVVKNGVRCELVIVDLLMPIRDGFETLEWIKRKQPTVYTVAISFDPDPKSTERAVRSGARAVLSKSQDREVILAALEEVLDTGVHTATMGSIGLACRANLDHANKLPASSQILSKFTPRELEFIRQACTPDDPSYGLIAHRMNVGLATVETYRRSVFRKLGVSTRQGLFRGAVRWGLASMNSR